MITENNIYHGDNIDLLKKMITQGIKCDLIYIDPPFGIKIDEKFGMVPWKEYVEKEPYKDDLIKLFPISEYEKNYLRFMYPRLALMRELLSEQGSIYVHIDWHVGHYMKILLDEIFGRENFKNEIVWHYSTYQGQVKGYFPRKHDVIFLYSKKGNTYFKLLKDDNADQTIDFTRWKQYLNENNEITGAKYPETDSRFKGYYNRFIKENHRKPGKDDVILRLEGSTIDSVWEIKAVDPKDLDERVGYSTQKPEKLIERIINASCQKKGLVCDFFGGSGTTAAVAEKLGRRWIICDANEKACEVISKRLGKEFVKI